MKQTKQRTPRTKVISLLLALVFLVPCLASCTPASAEGGTEPKSTAKQTTEKITTAVIPTEPATTEKPTTEAVTTEAVTTEAVTTETVTTDTVTEQAVTTEPTTEPNTTLPPVSEEVTTMPEEWVALQAESKILADGMDVSDELHERIQALAREAQGKDLWTVPVIRYTLQTDGLLAMAISQDMTDGPIDYGFDVGEYTICMVNGWAMWVYKNGMLLRLEDAYGEGVIDDAELALIHQTYGIAYNPLYTEVMQARSKIIMDESIVISDEFHEMLQDLAREAQGEKGLAISIIRYVLQTDELLVMGIAERKEYPQFTWMYCHTIPLGDASFSVLDGWWPWVYKDGTLLRLEDAYEQGLIDAEELELICAMNASYSYFPMTPKE